jgi:S1-C subfamily serine protease
MPALGIMMDTIELPPDENQLAGTAAGTNPPTGKPGLVYQIAGTLVPASVFLLVLLLVLYAGPFLLAHWRTTDAQAEADAVYLRRRAELRAEAEAADQRLKWLDKRADLTSLGFREVVRKVAPIVVNVSNFRELKKGESVPGKRAIFLDPGKESRYIQFGVGSGIVVKPGYVLTNHHVVRNAQRLRVTFASGQSVVEEPQAVSVDPLTDLAVIRLSPSKSPGLIADMNVAADFADSDKVQVGDWALAIGSPLGLRQTVTHGVISAKGRLLGMFDLVELLQTDAAINPGNSGGPLFDQLGRVVGINVAIASETGSSQGIGFAIPSNTARKIFEQLVGQGEVIRGYLGVALEELTGPELKTLGLADSGGVRIAKVLPKQAAANAGLQAGDIIVRFKNETLDPHQALRQLRQWILRADPEAQVAVEIIRSGTHQMIQVQMGKRPTAE